MPARSNPSRISRSDLLDRVWAAPLGVVAAQMGMTASGLAKLCDRLDVPRPRRTYWHMSARERAALKPELGTAGDGLPETVPAVREGKPLRPRTRMKIEDRREQLLDLAADLVLSEGVAEVTMKRLARAAGISEAQAHNCFSKRLDLLIALARRETLALEDRRRGVIARGHDATTAVVLSTITYLDEAQTRGPLLQALQQVPEVRAALREERIELVRLSRPAVLSSMQQRYGMSEAEALGANAILTAVVRRAGSLLAEGRIAQADAARITLSVVLGGMKSNAATGTARA